MNYQDDITRDKVDNQMTLLIDRDFMNDTLKASVLLIQSLNDGDGLVQMDLEYEYRDNITLKLGTDIFYGNRDGLFGQFSHTDRVTFTIEVGF